MLPPATLGAITLCAVDRRALWREALRDALGLRHPEVTLLECTTCGEVADHLRARQVHVILSEYCEHSAHLRRTIAGWKALQPASRILLLSASPHPRYAAQAAQAGADGFMTCHDSLETLWLAIREICRGGQVFPQATAVKGRVGGGAEAALAQLSAREFDVLLRLSRGCQYKEIGAELAINYKTAAEYGRRLMHKLQLDNPADLARFTIEAGLTPCACQAHLECRP